MQNPIPKIAPKYHMGKSNESSSDVIDIIGFLSADHLAVSESNYCAQTPLNFLSLKTTLQF
jgi:hypothetical protein